eukprot:1134610-Rhodomonas_salina.1
MQRQRIIDAPSTHRQRTINASASHHQYIIEPDIHHHQKRPHPPSTPVSATIKSGISHTTTSDKQPHTKRQNSTWTSSELCGGPVTTHVRHNTCPSKHMSVTTHVRHNVGHGTRGFG